MTKLITCATCIAFATGCASTSDVPGHYQPQIVYNGTAAYKKRVANFEITPDQAAQRAGKMAPTFHDIPFWGDISHPACTIDEWYLFPNDGPEKTPRIALRGIYVNGLTGATEYRQSHDFLDGDRALLFGFRKYPNGMPSSLAEAKSEN